MRCDGNFWVKKQSFFLKKKFTTYLWIWTLTKLYGGLIKPKTRFQLLDFVFGGCSHIVRYSSIEKFKKNKKKNVLLCSAFAAPTKHRAHNALLELVTNPTRTLHQARSTTRDPQRHQSNARGSRCISLFVRRRSSYVGPMSRRCLASFPSSSPWWSPLRKQRTAVTRTTRVNTSRMMQSLWGESQLCRARTRWHSINCSCFWLSLCPCTYGLFCMHDESFLFGGGGSREHELRSK